MDIIDNGQNRPQKNIRVILSFPRCGTHFMWTRYVHSGRYQLIFDVDIIPALSVLADECDETLDFLLPAPGQNPYYNFGYNSMADTKRSLTATQHLQALSEKYSAPFGFELFKKIMELQDNSGKILLLINRFVYTGSYYFLFETFKWKIEHAERSFRLLHKWLSLCGYQISFAMVIRRISPWVKSQIQMYGKGRKKTVIKRLYESFDILKTCFDLNVPVFLMEDVIRTMNRGNLDFENGLMPLSRNEIDVMWKDINKFETLADWSISGESPTRLRIARLRQYFAEKDPIKRISLVRSIGSLPIRISRYIPIVGRRIQEDYEGVILNNAKIKG